MHVYAIFPAYIAAWQIIIYDMDLLVTLQNVNWRGRMMSW